jgi:hypothetical protein
MTKVSKKSKKGAPKRRIENVDQLEQMFVESGGSPVSPVVAPNPRPVAEVKKVQSKLSPPDPVNWKLTWKKPKVKTWKSLPPTPRELESLRSQ